MISVVVATYNGGDYIIRELDSIRNQTIIPDEVIICDDGSKDNTVERVTQYIEDNNLSGWKVYQNKKNLGYCLNFFNGLSMAKGDYIFLADQDDLWYKNKVEVLSDYLNKNPECMAVSSTHDIIDGEDKVIPNPGVKFFYEINDGSVTEITAKSQIGSNNIRGCAMCIRKELLNYIESIKMENLLSHDWMLSIVACLTGKNVILNKYLFGYRVHGSNESLTTISRKTLIGDFNKRISGLTQSLEAYKFLLSKKDNFNNMTDDILSDIKKQIKFETRRLSFLNNRNLVTFFLLGFSIPRYGRLSGSFKAGVKIWLGDLAYAYHKITANINK